VTPVLRTGFVLVQGCRQSRHPCRRARPNNRRPLPTAGFLPRARNRRCSGAGLRARTYDSLRHGSATIPPRPPVTVTASPVPTISYGRPRVADHHPGRLQRLKRRHQPGPASACLAAPCWSTPSVRALTCPKCPAAPTRTYERHLRRRVRRGTGAAGLTTHASDGDPATYGAGASGEKGGRPSVTPLRALSQGAIR